MEYKFPRVFDLEAVVNIAEGMLYIGSNAFDGVLDVTCIMSNEPNVNFIKVFVLNSQIAGLFPNAIRDSCLRDGNVGEHTTKVFQGMLSNLPNEVRNQNFCILYFLLCTFIPSVYPNTRVSMYVQPINLFTAAQLHMFTTFAMSHVYMLTYIQVYTVTSQHLHISFLLFVLHS